MLPSLREVPQCAHWGGGSPPCLPPRGRWPRRAGGSLLNERRNNLKYVKKLFKVLFTVVTILFVVYFWNLDQKVLGWAYQQVNKMFDRKKVDQVF